MKARTIPALLVLLLGCAGSGAAGPPSATAKPTAQAPPVPSTPTASPDGFRAETISFRLRRAPDSREALEARRAIERRFAGTRVTRALEEIDPDLLRRMVDEANRAAGGDAVPPLDRFQTVRLPATVDPAAVLSFVKALPAVESAELVLPAIPAST